MSAKLWTPGPWATPHDAVPVILAGDKLIASAAVKGMPPSQQQANARLIQHASEMAEALEAIAAPDALLDATGGAFGPMAARRMQEIAKAILARIRGETP